jgi:hypothetical protein
MLDLPTLDAISTVPADDLPAVLVRLVSLLGAVIARQQATNGAPAPAADDLLDCAQAAALVGRSESWLRKHGRDVPGFVQLGHGGRVRWRRRALLAWAQGRVVG